MKEDPLITVEVRGLNYCENQKTIGVECSYNGPNPFISRVLRECPISSFYESFILQTPALACLNHLEFMKDLTKSLTALKGAQIQINLLEAEIKTLKEINMLKEKLASLNPKIDAPTAPK